MKTVYISPLISVLRQEAPFEPSFRAALRTSGLERLELIFVVVLVNDLIVMLLIAAFGVVYTHRIAGPVYRMEQDIERVLCGEKGVQIRLRRHDNFGNLADKINRLMVELEKSRSHHE